MSDIKNLLDYPYVTNALYMVAGLTLIIVIFRFVRFIQNRGDLYKKSKIVVEKKEEVHNEEAKLNQSSADTEEVKLNKSSVNTTDIIWGSYWGHKLYHYFHKDR